MAALIPSASATGSGTMTLAGPSTNSNQTVTIPDATGTMMVSGNMPAFGAYQSSAQTGVANQTWTKVLFQTEEFDTNNNFASSTFTPTVAGYYQLNSGIQPNSLTSGNVFKVAIYKNGSVYKEGNLIQTNTVFYSSATVGSVIYLNGSTDYAEIYLIGSFGGTYSLSPTTAMDRTYFNGCLLRSA
jgi:hypothetical protein